MEKIKSQKETIKTVLLTALIAGLVAFIAGVNCQKARQAELDQARADAIASIKSEPAAPKD